MRAVSYLWHGQDKDYSQLTVPLSIDKQKDLCEKFLIPADNSLCLNEQVYSYDFYNTIALFLYNLPEDKKNLETVQEKIGKYEYRQETILQNNKYFYDHWYDFTGDKKFPLVIQFDDSGKIRRIFTGVGRDSG